MTAHNSAVMGEIARVVLMPGDPLRAKYIADHFLSDVVQFNEVRNMFGYTGFYKGKKLSVMASGMGIPSMGIYSYELFHDYNVECIIRIGTSGAYSDCLNLFDVVLVEESWSDSSFARVQSGECRDVLRASEELNQSILNVCKRLGKDVILGRVHTSDVFYRSSGIDECDEFYNKRGCLCVDMETFALFHMANVFHRKAACLLTISDSLVSDVRASAEDRLLAVNDMIQIALESAIEF